MHRRVVNKLDAQATGDLNLVETAVRLTVKLRIFTWYIEQATFQIMSIHFFALFRARVNGAINCISQNPVL